MAHPAQELTIAAIAPEAAALALAGCELLDPLGATDAAELQAMCRRGQCFQLSGGACAVYVVQQRGAVLWVSAAKGAGPVDLSAVLAGVLEAQAVGFDALAFQTARPGLVRKMRRHGYRVAGWIMKKDLL